MVVAVDRDWAPRGADRLFALVGLGYYDGVRFHRVLDGYMAGFGIHGDPRVNAVWRPRIIEDDPPGRSNSRGTVSFAASGPNSRTTDLFINLRDNPELDELGFVPVGRVVEGMEVADQLHAGYGDGPPRGEGPYAAMAQARGNAYLTEEFPELDWIRRATVLGPEDP
jgi:peptidyl-prolyl cis-trans isomerase A (cyclophilin A)